MRKNKSLIILIIILCLLGLFLVVIYRNYRKEVVDLNPVMVVTLPSPSPTPKINSQVSPDGTNSVSLKTVEDATQVYVNDKLITTLRSDPGEEFSVPFNTWSPDNKYFFIKKILENGNEYIVMDKSGKLFSNNDPYLAIANLFSVSHPGSSIVDVTGWAAPTLVIINAKSDSEASMSFWFDIQTHKFIRLSTYFY